MSSVPKKLQQRTWKGRWAILSLPLPLQAIVIAFGWEVFCSQKNCNKEHGQEGFKIGNYELQKKHHPVQAMKIDTYLESGSRGRRKCCVESETRDRAISLICYIFRRSVQLFQNFVWRRFRTSCAWHNMKIVSWFVRKSTEDLRKVLYLSAFERLLFTSFFCDARSRSNSWAPHILWRQRWCLLWRTCLFLIQKPRNIGASHWNYVALAPHSHQLVAAKADNPARIPLLQFSAKYQFQDCQNDPTTISTVRIPE